MSEKPKILEQRSTFDYIIIGGGLSGLCAAITAARGGIKVALINDRPVLGGNASSEIRVWMNGAGSHMGNNNRWAREGGVIDEIISDNLYRNKEGNPILFDTLLLDKVLNESNISLFLNTTVSEICMEDEVNIKSVKAYNSINETRYCFSAPLFCDASGDGIVAYLAGAKFHDKAEPISMFDEQFKPYKNFGEMLGHTIFFYSKNTGSPVNFIAPDFALKDITKIPKYKVLNTEEHGCSLWWIEWGGNFDTIHDSEMIKYELWKIVYGIWDYIKNSGEFPEAENLTLEWVGNISGKRESRRFLGDTMIIQQDIVQQRMKDDAVAHGGWALDLHPADGIYNTKDSCIQIHSKGIYQIPYSIMYSKNINNLFITGRLVSASHIAFASTRVMMTCAVMGQVVGAAAVLCKRHNFKPRDMKRSEYIHSLQQYLLRDGQFIPYVPSIDTKVNKVLQAQVFCSSTYTLDRLKNNGHFISLQESIALLLPVLNEKMPKFQFSYQAKRDTKLKISLMVSEKELNYIPEINLESHTINLQEGQDFASVDFVTKLKKGFVFIVFHQNEDIFLEMSSDILSSVVTVFNSFNRHVAKSMQLDSKKLGVEEFEFWIPKDETRLENLAISFESSVHIYKTEFLKNGYHRPFLQSNVWLASSQDSQPTIILSWDVVQELKVLLLFFDGEYDYSPLHIQKEYLDNKRFFCVQSYKIYDDDSNLIAEIRNNYQARNKILLNNIKTKSLKIVFESQETPISVFGVQCF